VSVAYRKHINADGSPSELVTTDYQYTPGTELDRLTTPAIH
jgi:hypothetical protein